MAFGVCRRSLGFSLFGKSFEGLNFPVDILFYNVLFSCGIVGLVLVSLVIARAILCEENNVYILVVLIGNILLWVFEATIFSPLYISALFVAVVNLKNEETEALAESEVGIDKLIDEPNQKRCFLIMQAGVLAMFVGHTLWVWLQTKGIGNDLRMGVVNLVAAVIGAMVMLGLLDKNLGLM